MANIGYATLTVIPSARGFTSALNGQVAPGMVAAGSAGGKRFGTGMLAAVKGFAGPMAAIIGATALVDFLKDSVGAASDLNETVSKTGVIFGKATEDVRKFAQDSTRNILLTEQQALDAASTFGIFGKSAGLTGKDLSGFSTQLTALASDLSSFYNTSTDEAITAIGAALRGESEPIRRFGVLLDDASLRAEALKQGLISTTKQALTPQQRVLAAQALILKQTSDAQGDAARTSGGLANQQRILAKNFSEIKIAVGSALLPIVTKFVQFLNNNLLPAFNSVKEFAKPIIDAFSGIGGSIEGGGLLSSLQKTGASFMQFFNELKPTIMGFFNGLKNTLGPGLQQIGDLVSGTLLPAIRNILPVIRPVADFLLKIFGQAVIGALQGAINIIKGVIKFVSGLLDFITGVFTGDWSKAWNGIKNIFGGIWDAIVGLVQVAWNVGILGAFRRAGQFIMNITKALWANLKTAFKNGITTVLNFVKALPGKIFDFWKNLPARVLKLGKDIVMGLWNGIKNAWPAVIEGLKNLAGSVIDNVKSFFGISSPSKVFAEIGKFIGQGFVKGIRGSFSDVKQVFEELVNLVKETGNKKLLDAVRDGRAKMIALVKRKEWLQEALADAKSALSSLKDAAASYIKTVSDAIVATGNIATATTFGDMLKNLTDAVSNATQFNAVIQQLKNAGLNSTSLQQLIEAGPAEALGAAQALLASGDAGIAAVNELQAQLKAQGDEIGKTISGAVYDAAIADAEKAVQSIKDDLKKIEKDIVEFGGKLAKEIAKIGKIPAPSWLKKLAEIAGIDKSSTSSTTKAASGASTSSTSGTKTTSTSTAKTSGATVVVNNYNPVSEPTSVTVSNTMTRLALLGAI